MHSVLGQASAWRRISEPRAPGPMMPMRMRSLAPRTLDAANVPARPVATLPMKLRRDCMDRILLLLRVTDKTIIAKGHRGAEPSLSPAHRPQSWAPDPPFHRR